MLRFILFFVVIAFAALGLTWLMEQSGHVAIDYANYRVDMAPGMLMLFFIITGILFWFILSMFTKLVMFPVFWDRYGKSRKTKKGLALIEKALIELEDGRADRALAHAVKADMILDRPLLTRPILARAARQQGNHQQAQKVLADMAQSSETRLAGIRGLLDEARSQSDDQSALELARQAFALGDRSKELLEPLLQLEVAQRNWGKAIEVVSAQIKAKVTDPIVGNRNWAMLKVELARGYKEDSNSTKLEYFSEALKTSPDLIPAATGLVKCLLAIGKKEQAIKVVREGWTRQPHPELFKSLREIVSNAPKSEQKSKIDKILQTNKDHVETKIAQALIALENGQITQARDLVAPLANDNPTQRVCTLMAAIEKESVAGESVVRAWLTKAMTAPQDNLWTCQSCGEIHQSWHAVCGHCHGFGTIASGGRPQEAREVTMDAPLIRLLDENFELDIKSPKNNTAS